ncbi:MAG: DNA-protecting protein DprA [Deltaproteobacteria bacterium]|nr:DNA-protecting protein DprA [Deltaproteobacteria bacterium]
MKILITGSRQASVEMINYAKAVVKRAKEKGHSIIVGDAGGIDTAVIRECDRLKVPVEVWGAYGKLRVKSNQDNNQHIEGTYPERDRLMAARCDMCIAVWDGQSRGTKLTYDAAVILQKETFLKNFAEVEECE